MYLVGLGMSTKEELQEKYEAFEALLQHKQKEYERLSEFQKEQLDSINGDDLDKSDTMESPTENLMREVRVEGSNLDKLKEQIEFLEQYKSFQNRDTVGPATLVKTNIGNLLVAVPEQEFKAGSKNYTAISTRSPVYEKLEGKKAGEAVNVNGQSIQIQSVV